MSSNSTHAVGCGRTLEHRRGLLLGGIWLRCTTRWRARELDRQLAAGADPMQSDELSLRVGQLGSSKSRRRIACALRGAVAMAERDAYPVMAAPRSNARRCVPAALWMAGCGRSARPTADEAKSADVGGG